MTVTRDEIIRDRLNNMAQWAEERRIFMEDHSQDMKDDWYIRIGGNGYTAVSLHPDRPLLGFSSGTVTNLETIMLHFNKPVEPLKKLGRETPEKRAQAWLIRQALNNKLDLKTSLGLDDGVYQELLFALDELSFGDKDHGPIDRLDMLAVGRYNGQFYPILIELKYSRKATDLLKQLQIYRSEMKRHATEIKDLLESCTNRDVDLSRCGMIVVWPSLESNNPSHKATTDWQTNGVTVIESHPECWVGKRKFTFKTCGEIYPPSVY